MKAPMKKAMKGMESMKNEGKEMKMSPKMYKMHEKMEGPSSTSGKKGTYPAKGKMTKSVKVVKKK
jgi:hypothetical protein